MVRRFEVSYFELDIFCPEVLFCTKCNWESNRADWCRGIPRDDAVEWSLAWSKQTHVVEAHLCQSTWKDQVEPTSAVNEYSSKLGALDDWIEY